MDTIRTLRQLGDEIDAAWSAAGRDPLRFGAIAQSCLQSSELLQQGDPACVVRHLLEDSNPVPQDAYNFGEPSILVYKAPGFGIQILYWLDGSTVIHEHGFDGAFGVLRGSSVHSVYRFTPMDSSDECAPVRFGDLQCRAIELLRQGEIRPINADGDPHALFHLDYPSVSVVVRTFPKVAAKPQYNFLRPYVALNPTHRPDGEAVRLKTLWMLSHTDWPAFRSALPDAFSRGSASLQLQLLRQMQRHRWEDSVTLLEQARVFQDARPLRLLACVLEEQRMDRILSIRHVVRDHDSRRFLAYLLNATDREQLFSLVSAHSPDADPASLILRWTAEIFDKPRGGITILPNQLREIQSGLSGRMSPERSAALLSSVMETGAVHGLRTFAGKVFDPIFR